MRLAVLILLAASLSFGETPSSNGLNAEAHAVETTRLPVRRVVLFKNGVAYVEHMGAVSGSQSVSIDFTTSQLNDVLKSLTIIDLGKGRIAGVNYTSVEPLDRQLGSLRMGLGEDLSSGQFLTALRGARVEVRSGSTAITGRVLTVEERDVKEGKGDDSGSLKRDYLSVITDSGELRQFEMTPLLGVRLLEGEMREDVGRYLSVLASGREQDLRRMVINTAGQGSRQLQVSYISEVPVWKSTYRLVLPNNGAKPFIQGWAIVDNTVGEDWKDIELSLVAGAPQSFVQELSKPTYARRPVVALPETAMLQPQTHEAALNGASETVEVSNAAMASPMAADRIQQYAKLQGGVRGGVPGGVMGGVAGGVAGGTFGSVSAGTGGGMGGGVYRAGRSADSPSAAMAMQAAVAYGSDIGDMFEYKLKERVTIRKNQSALVPIIQEAVAAEKVTLWNEQAGRPLRAVWLKNTSTETLDAGTFNVLEDETFAGEGIMDPIKPGERRLLSYAVDQGVMIEAKNESSDQQVSRVVIRNGTMVHTREIRSHKVYVVHNTNIDARDVVIEHAIQPNWKLVSDVVPDETTATHRRFKVHVDTKQTATLKVDEAYPVSSTYDMAILRDDDVELFVKNKAISPEVEKALRIVLAKKDALAEIDRQMKSRQEQQKTIAEDQQRLRENLKALKGSAEERELVQRYTRQLNAQEDQLDRLKTELADLHPQREAALADLNKTVAEMTLDVTL